MEDEIVPQHFHMRLHCLCFIIIIIILIRSVWKVNSFQQFKLTCGTQERTSDQYEHSGCLDKYPEGLIGMIMICNRENAAIQG